MKDQIIKQAKDKGFAPYNETHRYAGYYAWMCFLQKWLREEHNIHVEIIKTSEISYQYEVWKWNGNEAETITQQEQPTYNQALETGIAKALKLV